MAQSINNTLSVSPTGSLKLNPQLGNATGTPTVSPTTSPINLTGNLGSTNSSTPAVKLGTSFQTNPTTPGQAIVQAQPANFSGSSSIAGLLNPHASLASSLGAGPVTSITTNSDGTTTTKHATSDDSSGSTTSSSTQPNPPVNNPNNAAITAPATGTPVPTVQAQPNSVSSTGTTSPTPTTPTASSLLSTVAGFSQPDQGLKDLYAKQQALDAQYANDIGNAYNTPTDLDTQNARISQIQSNYNTAHSAAAADYQANLAQRGQNIGAAESALGTANTLQSSPYGTPQVNPATGQVISGGQSISINGSGAGGAIQPNDPAYQALQQYAQMAANGQYSAIPNQWTSNPVINAQLNQMATTINPSYSPVVSAAQSAATTSNVTTGGTAAVNAGNAAYQQANPAYLNLKNNIIPNIDNFGTLLTQGAGGVNPFDSQHANMTLQAFQNELSSPQQAAFNATFQQLQKSIAALAGVGGAQTPTANSAQSDATLSPTAKMSTIQSTLARIAQEGNVYLTNQGNLSNAALNQAQGGNSGNTSYARGGAF